MWTRGKTLHEIIEVTRRLVQHSVTDESIFPHDMPISVFDPTLRDPC